MLKSILAVSLSLCLTITPAVAADGQPAGEVKAVIPAASRNDQILKLKDALAWNDLLRTDAKGRLRAGLTDGSILSLGSSSELRVVQHDAASQQTAIEVNYGKLRNQVVKITQPSGKYEVKTPNAVIGVIGTDFYVGYENNQTTVICYVGKVAVTPLAGAKIISSDSSQAGTSGVVTVAAGQMVVIGLEIPPGGYQPSETPRETATNSIQDTNVPDAPPAVAKAPSHFIRNFILATAVAAAGWTIGLTQLRVSNPAPPPPPPAPSQGCPNPQNPKCG